MPARPFSLPTARLIVLAATATASAWSSDLACFARIATPKFPPLALLARIEGTIRIEIPPPVLGDPEPQWTVVASHPIYKGIADDVRTWAKPLPTCAGRRLTLIFDFRIDRKSPPVGRSSLRSVEFLPPENTIVITSYLRTMQVD